MRLTLCWFGMELDLYLGETRVDDEPETVFEAGSYTSTPIGFAPDPPAIWEDGGWRRGYDEPDEAE